MDIAVDTLMQAGAAGLVIIVVIIFLRYQKEQNAAFMAFIEQQRAANAEALSSLTAEIHAISDRVADLQSALISRDMVRANNKPRSHE